MSVKYIIRLGRENDLTILNNIESEASKLFQHTKYGLEMDQKPLSIDLLRRQSDNSLVWVAVDEQDRPVGFAVVMIFDNNAHLHELSVHPNHGRKGLGTRLTKKVIQFAHKSGLDGVTLSTFRDVDWNAPFYFKLGFREMKDEELGEGLIKIRKKEAAIGLPIAERVIMKLSFETRPDPC